MAHDNGAVIIESRAGPVEKSIAPMAIMASAQVDLRRLQRLADPVNGSARKAYNARFADVRHAGCTITVAGPILGSPQAVLVLEKLVALGGRTIVFLGWCGSLQSHISIGDWLLPTAALSEEGTSSHYPLAAADFLPHPTLSRRLYDHCEQYGHTLHAGPVWTTDAPLRETKTKVRTYGERGIFAVEMEMSALFRVAAFRKVRLAGLLVVSDELFTLKWRPGFSTSRFKSACNQASRALLDFCASLPQELLG
jgi:uridine phosphorylase